jgi:colicin import membrane protein
MPRDTRFWRNVGMIALAHVALLVAFVRWSGSAQKTAAQNIVWMSGGGSGPTEKAARSSSTVPPPTPVAEETPAPPPDEELPALAPVKSDIELPTSTPAPTATPRETATPRPIAKPTATPKPKPTPSATAKGTPKKTTIAQSTPKAKPRATATPARETDSEDEESSAEEIKNALAKATVANTGGGKSGSGGSGHGSGAGRGSELAWYGNMLHDRFHNEWVQPTSVVATGAKMSALVKLRIEKDGRVSQFEIVKPSGNVVVDESVAAVGKRVTHVDPLPSGLGNGEFYEVKINFELNPEQ